MIEQQLLVLTPMTRLLLGTETSNSNFIDTAHHIPGSMVRGCLGATLHANLPDGHDSQTCTEPTCLFCSIFRDEQIRFGFAYYRRGRDRGVWPAPLTARSCKQEPGYLNDPDHRGHGVFDFLLSDLAWSLSQDPHFFDTTTRQQLNLVTPDWAAQKNAAEYQLRLSSCSHNGCQQTLKPLSASLQYYQVEQNGGQTAIDSVLLPTIERRTHVGINRARMVAEDGLLFTETVLDFVDTGVSNNQFGCTVTVPQSLAKAFADALPQQTAIGRGRSRGYGDIRIKLVPTREPYPSIPDRINAMQTAWHSAWKPYSQSPPAGRLITLTLRAPAILSDEGLPTRFPRPLAVGLPAETIPLRAWARTAVVGGWNQATKLPRPTRQAVRAGSTFAYVVPDTVPIDTLHAALAQIEQNGIGEERGQGYGETAVCATFHSQKARLKSGENE